VQAGHPPILVRHPDGFVERLPGGRSVPIGLGLAASDPAGATTLQPGTTLVMYTDGLIERRGETLEQGLARLVTVVRQGPESLEALADHLLDACVDGKAEDDIALLLARVTA
jgi:serine phosphatase RsbU (regulator of sigma subunit)